MISKRLSKNRALIETALNEVSALPNVIFASFHYKNIFNITKTQLSTHITDETNDSFHQTAVKHFKVYSHNAKQNLMRLNAEEDTSDGPIAFSLCLSTGKDGTPPASIVIFVNGEPTKAVNDQLSQFILKYTQCWQEQHAKRANLEQWVYSKMADKKSRYGLYGLSAAVLILILCIPIQTTQHFSAEIWPDSTTLTVETPGIIQSIYVKQGQDVHKGQLLLKMDSSTLESKLRLATANYKAALDAGYRAQITEPQKLFLQPKLLANIAKTRHERSEVFRMLQKQTIYAPTSGIISFDSNEISVGHTVNTGQTIMTLDNPAHQEISFYIPMNSNIDAHIGQTVEYQANDAFFSSEPAVIDSIQAKALFRNTPSERYITATAHFTDKNNLVDSAHGQIIVNASKKSLIEIIVSAPWAAINRLRNSEA